MTNIKHRRTLRIRERKLCLGFLLLLLLLLLLLPLLAESEALPKPVRFIGRLEEPLVPGGRMAVVLVGVLKDERTLDTVFGDQAAII